jgi:hypothetical protein
MNGSAVLFTRCAAEVHATADPALLPADAAALFAPEGTGVGRDNFYATAAWYRTTIATALPDDAEPCLVWVTLDGVVVLLMPLQRRADGALSSLTTPYSCLYQPLFADGLGADAWRRVGLALAGLCRPVPSLRLDALAEDGEGLDELCAGLRAGGLRVLRFDHFGNWYENVAGLGWDDYLASRDGATRETVRRRTARAARDSRIRIELFRSPEQAETGIAAFEDVYARSWKQPEPYPRFNAALMRMAAGQGVLRLVVMWRDSQPIAAQYWVVTGGRASVLKLAHDEAFKPLSPGTVLTAWMIRHLLDDEHVDELDFGRGDDPYKQAWTRQRRQRIGLLVVNPWRAKGLALLLRHGLGLLRRRLAR